MQASHQVQGTVGATKDDSGGSYNFMTSGQRRFWPAAYRTVLDVFSNSGTKVLSEKIATCSEGRISASRRCSLNLKVSAESALKNDSLTQFSLL